MHTVCDVRNINLYQGLKPEEIWTTFKRNLNAALDKGDRTRAHNPAYGTQPEYQSG